MSGKIILMFHYSDKTVDVEIPTDITADELIHGLNRGFDLGVDEANKDCYMRSENPIALIKGEMTLEELGLRNGTSVFYDELK